MFTQRCCAVFCQQRLSWQNQHRAWARSFRSRERKCRGTKRPVTGPTNETPPHYDEFPLLSLSEQNYSNITKPKTHSSRATR